MNATDIVRDMYREFPNVEFWDESKRPSGKLMLIFKLDRHENLDMLDSHLKEYGVPYKFFGDYVSIMAEDDEDFWDKPDDNYPAMAREFGEELLTESTRSLNEIERKLESGVTFHIPNWDGVSATYKKVGDKVRCDETSEFGEHSFDLPIWRAAKAIQDFDANGFEIEETNDESLMEGSIANQVRSGQDTKEMTRRAILALRNAGGDWEDLAAEFKAAYGEDVFENKHKKVLGTFGDIKQIGEPQCNYTGGNIWISSIPVEINGDRNLQVTYDTDSFVDEYDVPQFTVERIIHDGDYDSYELADEYGDGGVYVFDEKSPYYGLFTQLRDIMEKESDTKRESLKESLTNKVSTVEQFLDKLGYGTFHDSQENKWGDVEVRYDSLEDRLGRSDLQSIKQAARKQLGATVEFETDGRYTTLIFFGGKLDESLTEDAELNKSLRNRFIGKICTKDQVENECAKYFDEWHCNEMDPETKVAFSIAKIIERELNNELEVNDVQWKETEDGYEVTDVEIATEPAEPLVNGSLRESKYNNYDDLFAKFLSLTNFSIKKTKDGYEIVDDWGDIDNIGDERFNSAKEIAVFLEPYSVGYFLKDDKDRDDYDSFVELLSLDKSMVNFRNILDMLVNHIDDVSIDNVYKRLYGTYDESLTESLDEFGIYKKLAGEELAQELIDFWNLDDPYRDTYIDWEDDYFQNMTVEDLVYNIDEAVKNAERILADDEDLKLLGGPEFEEDLKKEIELGKELISKLRSLKESKQKKEDPYKQSRERLNIPTNKVFKDKSKYNRKEKHKRDIEEE